ncbi:TetR/AcrR family transcriptional regulator [Novosphingobium umbonatum]|uniref:TetR/AcrR family transcriptional regulator n=1 Tax=Novosphingobium umbonatum TaxID=1908524 RepID=A0A437N4U5_9SPHN|nr:TetR/AcrR family transcriptional regulator [Novosphingobium umbonatum]RVU04939.1 TetR/AcrR family transcriptional regulator [Novosphingobium umbonatum]
MRFKCDLRRKAILDAATALFRELGFERCSMSQISARVGGSKATLYSYFQSKDELFAAAMVDAMHEQGEAMLELLDPTESDVAKVLERFGNAYLNFVTGGSCLNNVRTAMQASSDSALGPSLYKLGPKKGWEDIAHYMAEVMQRGGLRRDDPHMAALMLKGMLESAVVYPMMFGAEPEYATPIWVERVVCAFMRAYGPDSEADDPAKLNIMDAAVTD